MNWKILLRPFGLPAFLLSLIFIPFFPVVTVAGALFYGGAIYVAAQRQKNKALPAGTEDEIGRLPYRRRKMANLAVAAARDVERQLTALPRDLTSRIPLSAAEAGGIAATVVFFLRQEADAAKLTAAGNAEMAPLAARATANAEKAYAQLQQLQGSLASLALAGVTADRGALALQAETAADEILALKQAMEAADGEMKALAEGRRE